MREAVYTEEQLQRKLRMREWEVKGNHMGATLFMFALVVLAFIGGMAIGGHGAADYALRKEHCEQAGGTLQDGGACAKVTVQPIQVEAK